MSEKADVPTNSSSEQRQNSRTSQPRRSNNDTTKCGIQRKLEDELERLKKILRLGYELGVIWVPTSNKNLSGEVKGAFIHVYDQDEEIALATLKHEFIDFAISKVVEPYKEVTNKLISLLNEDAYRRKEKLVEALTRLL